MPRPLVLALAALSLAVPLRSVLCAQQPVVAHADTATDASMAMLPMSSSSVAARMHATLGQRALDMGRESEAARHFQQAVAADSTSVFAHLGVAKTSTSFAEYDAKLKMVGTLSARATRAEQLLLAIEQKALIDDCDGAEAQARALVAAEPTNPRSYLVLATLQQHMGQEVEARRTMEQAIAVAPGFSPAYLQLARSYMSAQPTDPPRARRYVEKLVALEPTEAQAYLLEGNYYRATNQLPRARRAYTRASELAPAMSMPLQLRGHVSSFLRDENQARADYDQARKLGRRNDPATIATYRALVAAHAGDPTRAMAELDQLVVDIDTMSLPDPLGAKINVLTAEAKVAIATGDFGSARRALARRTPLVRQQVATSSDTLKQLMEANVAYFDGLVAARQGDTAAAMAKADDITRMVADTKGPRKDQPVHAILGVLARQRKDYRGAVRHLAQANPNDMYILYEHALALEGAGQPSRARELFRKIASYNFNDADVAVVRAAAAKRAR